MLIVMQETRRLLFANRTAIEAFGLDDMVGAISPAASFSTGCFPTLPLPVWPWPNCRASRPANGSRRR
ncbi:hypothetical protein ACFQ4K_26870 [Tistrella bauzanensis]